MRSAIIVKSWQYLRDHECANQIYIDHFLEICNWLVEEGRKPSYPCIIDKAEESRSVKCTSHLHKACRIESWNLYCRTKDFPSSRCISEGHCSQ